MQKTRVVIVDDSAAMRALIAELLREDGRFTVVGDAADPLEAREVIKRSNPDVVTLDVEMPRMDGLAFLDKIMRLRPMPVVMVSTETQRGSRAAVAALSRGAVDVIGKPADGGMQAFRSLPERVFVASTAAVAAPRARPAAPRAGQHRWNGRAVLIGASTGGVEALERVLAGLPADGPPVLITQHMPESFLASFAERLDATLPLRVALARDGAPVGRGEVALAPGGAAHLELAGRAGAFRCQLATGEPVSGHRPSVDVLFRSALPRAKRVVAVILTGMGRDGAEGMAALRGAGARTIAQDRKTSVVFGMPRVAAELGGVGEVRPVDEIAEAILRATAIDDVSGPAPGATARG